MNTLDDCDLLEKVVNMTNVHEHNDFTVSIKVQQFRSRCAKSVYCNRTRVVCECHGYKRDREPSRVPVRMLKRVSKKIRKLQSYVRSRLSKNVPKSMKFHDLIKNNATWKKSIAPSYIMHSVLEQRKQWQKQYISIGKTDLFYNSIGLCGNFTKGSYKTRIRFVQRNEKETNF